MLNLEVKATDCIGLEDFGGVEYLIPLHAKRVFLERILSRVDLLHWAIGRKLCEYFEPFPGYPYPFDPARCHVESSIGFKWLDGPRKSSAPAVDAWLFGLPVAADAYVFAYHPIAGWRTRGCPALRMRWDAFIDGIWRLIWTELNYLPVVVHGSDRFLIFGPERFVIFGAPGGVPEKTPLSDPLFGLGLLRIPRESDVFDVTGKLVD